LVAHVVQSFIEQNGPVDDWYFPWKKDAHEAVLQFELNQA
jgi:hypothetical protein